MSCACIYVDSDFATYTIDQRRTKATGAHDCDECGNVILEGDMHEYYLGTDPRERDEHGDDKEFTHLTCEHCLSIRDEFFCNGWAWGSVIEDVQDHVWDVDGEISTECLLSLTSVARGWVIDMIDDVFEDLEDECER